MEVTKGKQEHFSEGVKSLEITSILKVGCKSFRDSVTSIVNTFPLLKYHTGHVELSLSSTFAINLIVFVINFINSSTTVPEGRYNHNGVVWTVNLYYYYEYFENNK